MNSSAHFESPEENYLKIPLYSNYNEFSLHNLLTGLINIVFLGFVIYALVQNGKEDEYGFKKYCGKDGEQFFQWMIARVILSVIEIFIIGFMSQYISTLFQNPKAGLVSMLSLQTIAHIIYISLGIVFTSNVMKNNSCKSAMSKASFTADPLFGILGYVFVGIDSFIVMLLLCFALLHWSSY